MSPDPMPLENPLPEGAWQFVLEHIRNGVCVLDPDGRIVQANQPLVRWLESEHVLGRYLSEWVQSPDFTLTESDLVFEIRSESGIVRHMEAQVGQILDSDGELSLSILVMTDQSTSRALESVLVSEIQRITKIAGEDVLTGIANRRAFEDALEHVRSEHDRKFGVMIIDLNGFKAINDSLGHAVGDKVLKSFANRLKNLVREGDLVARLGGDEFAVLLPSINMVALTEAAERIRASLVVETPVGKESIQIIASLGYAHSGPNPETTVERADKWMYKNKLEQEAAGISALARHIEKANRKAV